MLVLHDALCSCSRFLNALYGVELPITHHARNRLSTRYHHHYQSRQLVLFSTCLSVCLYLSTNQKVVLETCLVSDRSCDFCEYSLRCLIFRWTFTTLRSPWHEPSVCRLSSVVCLSVVCNVVALVGTDFLFGNIFVPPIAQRLGQFQWRR